MSKRTSKPWWAAAPSFVLAGDVKRLRQDATALYEACKTVLFLLEDEAIQNPDSNGHQQRAAIVRDALAKAEGK
jgi:hypothetical protein